MHQGSQGQLSRNRPRAFLVQYLTLMLIVLSFMVGGFVTKANLHSQTHVTGSASLSSPEATALQGQEPFTLELFQSGSAELIEGRAAALRTLLSTHDVSARIEVFADPGHPDREAIGQAMARAMTLARALAAPEIPRNTIALVGALRERGAGVRITLQDIEEARP